MHRYFVSDIGIVEDSLKVNSIKFDINYYYCSNDIDICFLSYAKPDVRYQKDMMSVVKLECSHIVATKKVLFNGKMICVPEDSEKYLSERYGVNWRIPDKNYIYWKGPSTTAIDNLCQRTVF